MVTALLLNAVLLAVTCWWLSRPTGGPVDTFLHDLDLGRCVVGSCPWRWRDGIDRPCADHIGEHPQPSAAVGAPRPPAVALSNRQERP